MKVKHGSFSQKVVELARMVPAGKVTTYGRIARAAGGGVMASQSITNILGKAYKSGVKDIPFHRIVYADGHVWMSPEYEAKRKALYKKEKIELDEKGRIKDFQEKLFEYK
jgi:methylated-DNA-protein-cysteine methyltransferase-like protein